VDRNRLVKEECPHIPRGELPQNILRSVFAIERLAGATTQEALQQALAYMRREHPDFPFRYDEQWFAARG
jgi:hypothetical protein